MKQSISIRTILCTAALACVAVFNANANLVSDPGFEASADGLGPHPFSASWTSVDPGGFSGVGGDSAFAHSGDNYAFLHAASSGSLSQAFSTVIGQTYTLSFWLANNITVGLPPGNSFAVYFGGVQVFALTNQNAFGYTQFTISNLVATNASTALEFVYQHSNDFWRLDDISVEAQGVPEAFSTIWLAFPAAGAFALLHLSRRRTARSAAAI